MTATLKEVGLVTFLRDYLRKGDGNEIPSLRKLILGFGIIPVSPVSPPILEAQIEARRYR